MRTSRTALQEAEGGFAQLPVLRSDDAESLIDSVLAARNQETGTTHAIAWSCDWPRAIQLRPAGNDALHARAIAAVGARRAGTPMEPSAHILCDDGRGAVAVLLALQQARAGALRSQAEDHLLDAAGKRMAELLTLHGLRESVARLESAEKLQRALFAIADMAGSDQDMSTMLRGLHQIVGGLMYAENFYIAQYDASSDTIHFLYFVDSVDDQNPAEAADFPLDRIKNGPTWWMIRERKPLMGSDTELQAQVPGPLNIHGADSNDWLGVPMLREGQVQGVVVVQSYLSEIKYTSADMALLGFVGRGRF